MEERTKEKKRKEEKDRERFEVLQLAINLEGQSSVSLRQLARPQQLAALPQVRSAVSKRSRL